MRLHRTIRHLACLTVATLLTLVGSATAAHADTDIEPPNLLPVIDATVGVPSMVTFNPALSGETPVGYQYQFGPTLSTGPVQTVATPSGTATITLTSVHRREVLTVQSIAGDGTLSTVVVVTVLSRASRPYLDKDMDGDGIADLLAVGGTPGLPSGLWQATGVAAGDGTASGRVVIPATNIGVQGVLEPVPSAYDGAQVMTGQFTGDGFQDAFVYYPSGLQAGAAVIIDGSGDGSALDASQDDMVFPLVPGTFTDLNGDDPSQLANAYHTPDPSVPFYPDLIGISGDITNGHYLIYDPSISGIGGYLLPLKVSTATPDGTSDWANWRIATAPVSSGTAMFLWKPSTGQLYLWESVTVTDNGDFTGRITYTQYEIATHWNAGAALSTVEATDFFGDGVPDLWTVDDNGIATAWQVSHLSATRPAHIDELYRHQLIG